jgi:hypothetical protein
VLLLDRIPCYEGRALELVVVVHTAPGSLARYTKVVRILPRYVAVNHLAYPVRLWQDNSSFRIPTASTISAGVLGSGKWKLVPYRTGRNDLKKVNQYESLWGREVNISFDEVGGQVPDGTSARETALYIATLPSSAWRPFNLPDSRGDRQIRVGQGAAWNLSSSVSADIPGEHTLRVTRSTDIRLLKHVSTRASPQYSVTLPPPGEASFDDELGIWFETEWGSDRSLLVKAVKHGSYCFEKTDLRVGDELLAIDDIPVSRLSFSDAMGKLRQRLAEIKASTQSDMKRVSKRTLRFGSKNTKQNLEPDVSQEIQFELDTEDTAVAARSLKLTFRTSEERLRRVRRKAAKYTGQGGLEERTNQPSEDMLDERSDDSRFVNIELRPIHNMTFVHLSDTTTVPYEIRNSSRNTTVYFRQRGCSAHPWRSLKPGASDVYTWEEPLKTKRLSVRVALPDLSEAIFQPEDDRPPSSRQSVESGKGRMVLNDIQKGGTLGMSRSPRRFRQNRKVRDEEDSIFSPSLTVRLDEIGFSDIMQLSNPNGASSSEAALVFEVGVSGSTRVLAIRDVSKNDGDDPLLQHLEALESRAVEEERRLSALGSIATAYKEGRQSTSCHTDALSTEEILQEIKSLTHEFPEERTLSAKHQIVVEVLEAIGLSPDNYIGVCNPYVEVSLNSAQSGRQSLFRRDGGARRTYYVRKSLNPKWNKQSFVFDVPREAASVTRGHSLRVKVRNFRKVGTHTTLGRAQVDLHSVRDQKPVTGWFPLVGKTGRRELENSTSHWGRGSIRLSIHWVFTTSALLDYFILLTERRLRTLQESIESMQLQMERKRKEKSKEMELADGFRAVRLNNPVLTRDKSNRITDARESGVREGTRVQRIIQPVLSRARDSIARVSDVLPSSQLRRSSEQGGLPPALAYGKRIYSNESSMASSSGGLLNEQIVKVRHDIPDGVLHQMQDRKREIAMQNYVSSGSFPLTSFKSWLDAQKLVNDKDLKAQVDKEAVHVRLSLSSRRKKINSQALDRSENNVVPFTVIPPLFSLNAHSKSVQYSKSFSESRRSFERFSRCALRVALNPGGWLTIRPIQAKNLPDSSSGMSVKVQYDTRSQSSETVDSTVSPTWFKELNAVEDSRRADAMEYLPGDLHFYIPPQRTNGYLRLSIIAEGRHQGITTKSEVGVLHIPLGGAIAACVNAVEDFLVLGKTHEGADSPIYIRWFPLKQPQDEIPVEGDQLFGRQPTESEKIESDQFTEYFTPCVQLGLIWSPDVGRDEESKDENESGVQSHHPRPVGVFASQVKRYINADFNQVSCALIDSRRSTELLSCTLTDIDIRHWVTVSKSRYGVSLGWFQFDQQNESAREPVVLCPTQKGVLTPVLQMLAVKDNMRSEMNVLSFDFVDFSISEFDLSIEERFLFQLSDFFAALRLRAKTQNSKDWRKTREETNIAMLEEKSDEPSLFSVVSELSSNEQTDQRVYIQQLCLGVLKFNISYMKGKKERTIFDLQEEWNESQGVSGPLRQQQQQQNDSDAFRRWSQNTSHDEEVVDFLGTFVCVMVLALLLHVSCFNLFFFATGKSGSSLPSLIASLFPNVSDAPVRLQAKSLNHVFYSPTEILLFIMGFYQTEVRPCIPSSGHRSSRLDWPHSLFLLHRFFDKCTKSLDRSILWATLQWY